MNHSKVTSSEYKHRAENRPDFNDRFVNVEGLQTCANSYDYLVESWGRGNGREQSSLPHATTTTFLIKNKHFLTNHILVIGILATGCRLITSSSIHSILYLSINGRRLPCGYKSCPVAHDKNCLPPNNRVLL
jgi:hypothetical protein